MPTRNAIVDSLLEFHGRTFAAELGVDAAKNTPPPLFRLLCFALLASAPISADIAMQAAQALASEGWITPEKMRDATWRARTGILNAAGYARYDESTSSMLNDTAEMLMDRYGGDLRKLRKSAGREPAKERRLLKEFKGLGNA